MDATTTTTTTAAPRSIGATLKRIRNLAASLFVAPMLVAYLASGNQAMILSDVRRWRELEGHDAPNDIAALLYFLAFFREFRNLYYYRCKQGGVAAKVTVAFTKILFPEPSWLAIRPRQMGPGFFVQHGVGSNINGESIGANCRVNQQVTIGYGNGPRLPRIGNNVHIGAGARILGDVVIGDNVIIGANAVVTKNVPPNCTVVGVPAYIVRRDGKKVREEL